MSAINVLNAAPIAQAAPPRETALRSTAEVLSTPIQPKPEAAATPRAAPPPPAPARLSADTARAAQEPPPKAATEQEPEAPSVEAPQPRARAEQPDEKQADERRDSVFERRVAARAADVYRTNVQASDEAAAGAALNARL